MTAPFPLDDVARLAIEGFDDMVDVRRAIHAEPELGFEEHRTTALVRAKLVSLGLAELPCPTETGAVFALEGGRPGRTVLLRADLDALPIEEEVSVPFRSRVSGVMHACGHDGHVAMLIGVARLLAARQDALAGRFVFLFQPAEELCLGAAAMIRGGVLEHVRADYALSMHLVSPMPTGLVGVRPGVCMAGTERFRARLSGAGGHGATGGAHGNVVLAAAALAQALPGTTNGMSYEGIGCVCGAGTIHAGTAHNVVPRAAVIEGTLRTFTAAQRDEALGRIREACAKVAAEYGLSVELEVLASLTPVTNDAPVAARVRAASARLLGEAVVEPPPVTPSDDVSEFLNRIPGCHVFVGAAPARGLSPMHHSPDFSIDERSLEVGAKALSAAAIELSGSSGE